MDDKARVRFDKYGAYSLDIEIFTYVNTSDLTAFKEIQEDVLLRVKEIIKEADTDFAFPSQTTYLSQDNLGFLPENLEMGKALLHKDGGCRE